MKKRHFMMRLLNAYIVVFFLILITPCFGVDEVQFDGKGMEIWLQELIGSPFQDDAHYRGEQSQKDATEAFHRMGSREFDYLVRILPDATSNEFRSAAIVLAFKVAGTNAVPEIPKLIQLYRQGRPTSFVVTACLSGIGTNAIPTLLNALTDSDYRIREGAASALAEMGMQAKTAVPILLDRVNTDTNARVRAAAIIALERIKEDPERVIPELLQNLTNSNPRLRASAAIAVIFFGRDIQSAAPELVNLLHDDNAVVRNNAVGALMDMNLDKQFVPQLLDNVSNPDPKVRSLIAQALGKQGLQTEGVVPALLKLTKDPDRYVRESAGFALNETGYKPPVNMTNLRGLSQ